MLTASSPSVPQTDELDYADFAHTGPGTLAGRFMRSFWQPVYVSNQLPAGKAVGLRVMSEDLTLYRGETGAVHLVAGRCAHRATELAVGRVEDDCLRCFYHGWKYDQTGQCIQQPGEDPRFAQKVQIATYPVREYQGLVFAYLGEGEPPELPRYAQFENAGVVDAGRGFLPYNYFNQLENSVDPVHVAFVHGESRFTESGLLGVPSVVAEETEFGIAMYPVREGFPSRAEYFQMPTVLYLKVYPYNQDTGWRDFLLWRVPVDDSSFFTFFLLLARVTGEAAERYRQAEDRLFPFTHDEQVVQVGEAVRRGELTFDQVPERRRMVAFQDYVAQRGQGVIADRTNERLGRADVAVILLRKLWSRELRAVAEGKPRQAWTWSPEIVATSGV